MKERIGFIGTGHMGEPMAVRLLKAGYPLRVWNRTREKLKPLLDLGAKAVEHPDDTVEPGDVAITMLANDEALREVTLGPRGLLRSLEPEGIHISMSTVSPALSRELAALHHDHAAYYLAATVSGRPEAAAAGQLGIYLSGESVPKPRAREILNHLGRNIGDCGEDPGGANVVKLAANFMLFSAVEAFAEALAFAEKHALDRSTVVKLICDNLFDCAPYRGYGQLLAERNYEHPEFSVGLAFKDLCLCIESSESVEAPMRLAETLRSRFLNLEATGKRSWDVSAIGRGAAEEAGLPR